MKKRQLFYLLVLFTIASYAEEKLVIDKLLYKQSDLTASTQPRLDQNGDACGLLKIITSDKSMTFEGSIMGDVQYRNGEYWVYIPAGTYQIRIKTNEKEPLMLNFRNYNLKQVESKATYELTFNVQDYDKMDMKEWKIISGPRPQKYAISILTLPAGLTIKFISALDYMKNLSSIFARDGDVYGEKQQCTILYNDDEGIYRLIVESVDSEESAIFGAAAGHGGFEEKIYEVINN